MENHNNKKRKLLYGFLNGEISSEGFREGLLWPTSPIGKLLESGKIEIDTSLGKRAVHKDSIKLPEEMGVFIINDVKPKEP